MLAARHSIAGQGLAKSVCKATTEEVIGPKKKHLDYLLHCTNEPNVSIPQLANLLIERSQNSNWVVVFKALVTTHHLMCYGNERFTQYLASSNCSFQLSNFLDKGNVAGATGMEKSYDMSPYIRRYAKYLNEKALAYRTVAFDFCKVKRGKEDGTLRTMPADKLLKTLPALQNQIDALLEFDCSANDLTNGVVNTAFLLLFRDLIRLFACYNDGIINLLEKYFEMNKKQCKEALDFYKKFLVRMDRVAEFLKVAENVGIDKGDIPDLTKAPSSLLEALEAHLATLEGKKPSTSSSSNISNLSQHNGAMAANAEQIDESLKRQALAEEEAAMNQYKKSTNPFLSSPTVATAPSVPATTASQPASQQPILDLFGSEIDGNVAQASATTTTQRASDDLLQLAANPFASPTAAAAPVIPPLPAQTNSWAAVGSQNGFNGGQFVTDNAFASAFGAPANGQSNGFDAFGDLLQPSSGNALTSQAIPKAPAATATTTNKVLTGDLDSSLASLAMNLTINKSQPAKPGQWGANAGARPAVPVQPQPVAGQWNAQPMMAVPMQAAAPMNMQAGQMAYRPMVPMAPMPGMTAPFTAAQPMNAMASSIRPGMMAPAPMVASATPFAMGAMSQPNIPVNPGIASAANQQLDPFGAL